MFKDRRTGLVIYGIFEIIGGVLCAVFIPLMILGAGAESRTHRGRAAVSTHIARFSGVCSARSFVGVLGIGSIRA